MCVKKEIDHEAGKQVDYRVGRVKCDDGCGG